MNDMALVATLVSLGPHCVGHCSSMPVGQAPIAASAAAEATTAGPSAEACSAHTPGCQLHCPQLANTWLGGAADTASDTAAASAGITLTQPAAAAAAATADVDAQLHASATRQGSPPGIATPAVMAATDPCISGSSTDGHITSHSQQQQQQQEQEEEDDMEGDNDANSLGDSLDWQQQHQQQQGETSPASGNGQPAAAGEGASEVPAMLLELDVSLDSLTRLLTGDCPVDSQQPVWMVINLQGKIKGSYTAGKMLEFSRRGTLSSAQLILGIDKDLPYVSRQDLGFYRRLDEVLKAVHAGAVYSPLTQQTVSSRAQQGLAPAAWQPVPPTVTPTPQPAQDAAATACGVADGPGCSMTASESISCQDRPACGDASSSGGAALAAAEAAAAQLQLALEKLCGSSKSSSSSSTTMTNPEGGATSAAASTAASTAGSPALSRASSLACSPAPGQDPGSSSSNMTASAATAGASAAAEAAVGTAGSNEEASSSREPLWLYINHLGWCRGPFPGEKMVQAHLCGRLPRDTLVVCHNPELPASLLCMDVAYYFRPFGVLLDNVVNGWRYQPVDWLDVSHRGLIKAMQQQQQQQQVMMEPPKKLPKPWTPLIWDGLPHGMAPLINPEQLLPPKHVPTMQPLPGAAGATGPWPSSNSSSGVKLPRRRRVRPPYRQQQQLGQQGYPGPSRQLLDYSRAPDSVRVSLGGLDRGGVGPGQQSVQSGGAGVGGIALAAASEGPNFGITQQQQQLNPLQLQAEQQAHLQQHMLLLQVQEQQQHLQQQQQQHPQQQQQHLQQHLHHQQQQQQQLNGFVGVSSPVSNIMLSALPTQSHGLAVYPTQNEQLMMLQQQQQLAVAVSSPAVHQDPPSVWLLQQQQQEQQAGTAHLAQQLLLLQSPTQQLHNNNNNNNHQQQQLLNSPQQLAAAFGGRSQHSFQPHSLASSISSTASTLSSQAFSHSSGLSPAATSLAAQAAPAAGMVPQAGGLGTSDTFLLQLLLQQQQQQVVPLPGPLLTSHPISAAAEACGVEQMMVPSLQGLSMSTGFGLAAVPQQQPQQQLLAAQLPYQMDGVVQLMQQNPAAQYQHQNHDYLSSQQQQQPASLVAAYQQQQDPQAHAQAGLQLHTMWQ